jgi:hypothetical protein
MERKTTTNTNFAETFCQSCGMPMTQPEEFGTESCGAKSDDYCVYCFKDGKFTTDMTMDEMIAFCAEYADEWEIQMSKDEAIVMMRNHFPHLKRWKTC